MKLPKLIVKTVILFCIISTIVFVISSCHNRAMEKEPDSIADIYLIDDQAFYITLEGHLYSYDDTENSCFIHAFPSHIIDWSDTLQTFLFYEDEAIRSYSLSSDSTNILFDLASLPEAKSEKPSYVICSSDKYIFLRHGDINYKVDISSNTVTEVPFAIHNLLFVNEDNIFYQSSDYQTIGMLNCMTNKNHIIVSETTILPVISACMMNDVFFYVRSDGRLQSSIIAKDSHTSPTIIFTEPEISENILAVEYSQSDEKLICVVGEQQLDLLATSVISIAPDGTTQRLRAAGAPLYSVPGTCILEAGNDKYIFTVTTDSLIICGSL